MRRPRGLSQLRLVKMIRQGSPLLPAEELTAEVNADDLAWLGAEWQALPPRRPPERSIHLAENQQPGEQASGCAPRDNRAQVDNRFEGRISRLEAAIQRSILQQLFPADIHAGARVEAHNDRVA